MTTVDTKGRVTLPKELRERLGLEPGTEVEISDEDGRIVIERERDPDDVIAELERRIERSYEFDAPVDEPGSIATAHRDAIDRGARDE
ncbi:AbrB/MazE/SpoVT family DNA-binding domain-containing protein [Halococcus dombrowskii]|uniref:AbrB/MazE/SpoVT family DNA-binding domain-containing protein n=1 Tax=Halococcus dombrowskii TaxID=179637 RepID=A0AAV3SMA7_HALDO|nr:AbrB/MazE/SpoVT family DNA-binding domain-containing protein [Halococcus dombrowskii]UOO95826.1 AbrB/MazE/SpoVT family DNA-binding domain-containing protein [Halococcus dombrowskii]